jgi:hypothetical protein
VLIHPQALFDVPFGEGGLRLACLTGTPSQVFQGAWQDPEGEWLLGSGRVRHRCSFRVC